MLPVEHLIVALLPVTGYVLVRDRALPSPTLAAVVFAGSQFPDLVDKPLAHVFGVIPSGRVFMHSLPFALPISALVCVYAWKTGRPRTGGAFAVAYLSHLFADNYRELTGSNPRIPADLLWPFVAAESRPALPYWAGPDSINLYLWTAFSAVFLGVIAVVLVADLRAHLG